MNPPVRIAPLLDAIAAHGLTAADPPLDAALPDEPLDPTAWAALRTAVRNERLDGSLARVVADGALATTVDQRVEAETGHEEAMALVLLLERELGHLGRRLDAAGIGFRVLKGSALAHLDEVDPARRAFGDLDLLVAGDDLAAAAGVVVDHGGRRRYEAPHADFDRRFGKGAAFAFARNAEVDLHRTLAPGPFGLTIDTVELLAHHQAFAVGSATFLALDRPSRFLHAGVHALLGGPNPRRSALRDLVLTAPADDAERREALGRAERWGLAAVTAAAVVLAADRFGWAPDPPLAAWARRARPSARDARWLRAYHGGARSSSLLTLTGLEAVPGTGARLSYAWTVGRAALRTSGPTTMAGRLRHTVATARRLPR